METVRELLQAAQLLQPGSRCCCSTLCQLTERRLRLHEHPAHYHTRRTRVYPICALHVDVPAVLVFDQNDRPIASRDKEPNTLHSQSLPGVVPVALGPFALPSLTTFRLALA